MQRATSHPGLRVVLVDADGRVRESLAGLFGLCEGMTVVGAAAQPSEAISVAIATRPDVVVLDPKLPDLDTGLALIPVLREYVPAVRILVMGWSDELESRVRAAGADALVAKSSRPNELIDAVVSLGAHA